ncbi:hypothetical protein SA19142_10180 [Staphylococcus argenteus]|nr:hypothetical protein SARG0275_01980 [Staphylococcus argenteus]GBU01757.1 hypothetical protein SARG0275_08360 [Staphylococcus argenteus]GJF69818.1 hypothetical protein SA19142_10180 [Staphylococcus argenteus]GJF80480.1 hypothetical protein SA19252_14430 [Staphylococcus argenteus]
MPLGFFEVVYNGHDNLAKIGMCMLKMYSKNTKYKNICEKFNCFILKD